MSHLLPQIHKFNLFGTIYDDDENDNKSHQKIPITTSMLPTPSCKELFDKCIKNAYELDYKIIDCNKEFYQCIKNKFSFSETGFKETK